MILYQLVLPMQAQKIRQLLRDRGLGSVRVGTVDDYQGQEERIIFISTVSFHQMFDMMICLPVVMCWRLRLSH